jgi:hypothetical protein
MSFYINEVEVPISIYNSYIRQCINKIFKILPIYENCEEQNDFKHFISYLDKLIIMFTGSEILFNQRDFIDLISILKGLQEADNLNKNKIKSIVFHCINILDRLKVDDIKGA